MATDDIPASPRPSNYLPDLITLYGIRLNLEAPNTPADRTANIPFGDSFLRLAVMEARMDAKPMLPEKMVIAVVYGFSFEGLCYRNDKPRLLVFHPDSAETSALGCGFSGLGYVMWGVKKKTPIMELATSTDFAEEIVLNANLPGNRNPNTYGNSAMLGHRGGKLTRGNGSL